VSGGADRGTDVPPAVWSMP